MWSDLTNLTDSVAAFASFKTEGLLRLKATVKARLLVSEGREREKGFLGFSHNKDAGKKGKQDAQEIGFSVLLLPFSLLHSALLWAKQSLLET